MPSPEVPARPVAPPLEPRWLDRTAAGAGLGGVAAIGAALLAVRRDGWLEPRLLGVAWNAFRRHLEGPGPLVRVVAIAVLALLLCIARRRVVPGLRKRFDGAVIVLLATALFLVATGHLVAPTPATPGWRGAAGIGANVALALFAAALAASAAPLARRGRVAVVGMLLAAAAPLLLGLSAPTTIPPLAGGGSSSVVLISIDTLRADRLGCYGYARDTTASLDRFAADSVRFAQATTPYPFTLTAHASLLTGLDPAAHGAIPIGPKVDQRLPPFTGLATLAQAFRDAGWLAVAVVDDCLWLQPSFGLGRGFDVWRVVGGDLARKAQTLEQILRDLGGRRCFLFFHCFDVHSDYRRLPYDSAAADRGIYSGWYHGPFDGADPADPAIRASDLLRKWNNGNTAVPDEVVRYVSDLYDEGVRSTDRALGVALAQLDRAGFRDHAAVLITADHGEEFREHGRFMHDAQLFQESVHVPLLLRLPGAAHAGEVVATPVSLIDVAPTLAAIAGLPFDGAQGRPLLARIGADEPDAPPVFLGAQPGEAGVRLGRFKLVRRGETSELFDLASDPGERNDVAAQRPEVVRSLTALIDARAEADLAAAAARVRSRAIPISDAERKRMSALGYQ